LVPSELVKMYEELGGNDGMNCDDLKRFMKKLAFLFHSLFDGFVKLEDQETKNV